jgi:hypothetical protein
MALKTNVYQKDYLFWLYPLIILGLLFIAIRRDNNNKEAADVITGSVKVGSSVITSTQTNLADSLSKKGYDDRKPIFFTNK